MRCPFCAEQIQDEAILCRFCGAQKSGDQWLPPTRPIGSAGTPTPSPVRKGTFTIKTAAVFFLATGIFSLTSLTSAAPLFGELRGGLLALVYNIAFTTLFTAMGVGLWMGQPWGYRWFFIGTTAYTLDRANFLLDSAARSAYLESSGLTGPVSRLLDPALLDQVILLSCLLSIACWWGFALYLYIRRDYFGIPKHDLGPP